MKQNNYYRTARKNNITNEVLNNNQSKEICINKATPNLEERLLQVSLSRFDTKIIKNKSINNLLV